MRQSPAWLLACFLILPVSGFAQDDGASEETTTEAASADAKDSPDTDTTEESSETTPEVAAPTSSESESAEEAKETPPKKDDQPTPTETEAEEANASSTEAEAPPEAPQQTQAQSEDTEDTSEESVNAEGKEAKASATVTASTKKKGKTNEDDDQTALLGAANPLAANKQTRPWNIFTSLTTRFGTSNFISDPNVRQANFGYSLSLGGLYRLTGLGQGRLDIFGQLSASQSLTAPFTAIDPTPRRFYFNDIFIGFLGRGLYTEPVTGILFNAGTNVALPTSEIAQTTDRILAWNTNFTLVKVFTNVGPGMFIISFRENFRTQFGPRAPNLATDISGEDQTLPNGERFNQEQCPQFLVESADCVSSIANANISFTHSLALRYLFSGISLSMSYALTNAQNHYLGESELPQGITNTVSSPHASQDGAAWTALQSFTLAVGYAINRYFSVSAGMTTFQGVYDYDAETGESGFQNPFIDTDSFARNATSFFVGSSFNY